jgi:hypothetical protein
MGGQKKYSRAKIKNNQNSSTNYQYTGGQKKYSRAKIKNNQNSSTNYQYTGGQKKYSKGKNHKTPNSYNPTDLSYNPTDLIKTKPKNKIQIKQYNTRNVTNKT